MIIKFLSESTINRIAAGEVIERPASVVKELVENAIDASSSKIDIILECAGKNLIIISDDGIGMSVEELEVAVERHTTSKLDENDLLNIRSFGFRGEALPSIGAISKMSISSKKRDKSTAHQVKLIGGKKQINHTTHNEGTKVEIRDLFYATPARLKFLRTDKTELAACVDVVKKLALSNPKIAFSLVHDGKNLLKVQAQNKDFDNNLKQRIIDIMKQEFIQNSAYISLKTPELTIYGYTSIPTYNRATSEDQFLFINNRPVRDKILQVALKVAYQDYLARDRFPVCVVFLQIDPQLVDVNVHPAKAEVRFHDPSSVRSLFINAIKDALGSKSNISSTTIADSALRLFQNPFTRDSASSISDKKDTFYRSHAQASIKPDSNYSCQKLIDTLPYAKIENDIEEKLSTTSEIEIQDYRLGAAKAQLHTTYILSQTEDSIIIVDQHAAHERLGYEIIKKSIERDGLVKQRLLIPEIVELPDAKRANILDENKDRLANYGLSLEKFGEVSIIVTEIPSLLGDINTTQLILDLSSHLLEVGENISLTQLIEYVTETYACHYSIRSGRKLSRDEMNALLRQMESTPFSAQCNHGRPTYIELKLKDIERLFGRR